MESIIITNKILDSNQYGTLPENIENIFSLIQKSGYQQIRRGVSRTINSFLEAVMVASREKNSSRKITDKFIQNIRTQLSTPENAALCRQEMYDYSIEQIQTKISSKKEYFDPKLFCRLLEYNFKCNIILFSKTGNR